MELVGAVREPLLRLDLQEAIGVLRRQLRQFRVLGHHPFRREHHHADAFLDLRRIEMIADLPTHQLRLGMEQVNRQRDRDLTQDRHGVLGTGGMGGDQTPVDDGDREHRLRGTA